MTKIVNQVKRNIAYQRNVSGFEFERMISESDVELRVVHFLRTMCPNPSISFHGVAHCS